MEPKEMSNEQLVDDLIDVCIDRYSDFGPWNRTDKEQDSIKAELLRRLSERDTLKAENEKMREALNAIEDIVIRSDWGLQSQKDTLAILRKSLSTPTASNADKNPESIQ